MVKLILNHWLLFISVGVGVMLLWVAAVLSKYVRLMLNIFRDTAAPPLMGPADCERLEGRQVNFRAFDGTRLRGMFYYHKLCLKQNQPQSSNNPTAQMPENSPVPETRGVIIFCHEYGFDGYSCLRYCRRLLEVGFDVFTFDFRSHGASSSLKDYQPRLWCTDKEVSDCLGALALVRTELKGRNLPLKVGFFGISRGAAAAILAAAQGRSILPVRAVLADGAFSTDTTLEWLMKRWVHIFARVRFVYERHRPFFWHFLRWLLLKCARVRFNCHYPSVLRTVRRLKDIPIFFIHGAKDSYIQPEHTRMLFENTRSPRYLWIVPEAKHNQSVLAEPELYAARTVGFFAKHLTESSAEAFTIAAHEAEDLTIFFSSDDLSFPPQSLKEKEPSDAQSNGRILCGAARPASAEAV